MTFTANSITKKITEKFFIAPKNKAYCYRTHFSNKLHGHGLEIGPLHRPMIRHQGMSIDYIDRFTTAELRKHYPELNNLPLVEPDIIGNAENLEGVPDGKYDFVISAHVIEHMRNPLGSLESWLRVLKPKGLLYLIVPDKREIFDKERNRTSLDHIILDYIHPSLERDFEHFFDYALNVHGKNFRSASEEANRLIEEDYSIHFHVFVPEDMLKLLNWFSANIQPLTILEGPKQSAELNKDEFHFLVQKS